MDFGDREIGEVSSNEILTFLDKITDGRKQQEIIVIPPKVPDRLKEYIRTENIGDDQRIFPICYETARAVVKNAGDQAGIHLRPHDLRRHAATYASRSGVPFEIISKVILRHAHLSTTQMYLGKIMEILLHN